MSDETAPRSGVRKIPDSGAVTWEKADRDTPELYEFGPFRLDLAERRLMRGDEKVELTPKAFDTLVFLVRNSGHLLEKERFVSMLWPDSFVEEGSLSNNIFLLRRALGEDPVFIETVPRRGYRFVGAVRQFPGATTTTLPEKAPEAGAPGSTSLAKARWRSRAALGIVAAALLASLGAAARFYRVAGRGGEAIDSVAVLPFVNASADPNTEYLSDGITESLINSLSQLPHLRVMSRDSAFMYKGKDTDARAVGQALGVRAVLKGHVMQRGDDLEISAELVDARDDSHIWGQQYSRKAADIFALQVDLAKDMTSMLRMRLTGEDKKQMTKSYTANPEAYQLSLQGRFWWNKRTEEGFNKAIDYFQQAIAKDPSYALAYAGL